jgi:hypothetical protein
MYQRMKVSYRLSPLARKSAAISDPCQVPQYSGNPGWIYLTHDANGTAHAYFTDAKGERPQDLALVMDERVCCDTIFRVVRLQPTRYIVYDVLYDVAYDIVYDAMMHTKYNIVGICNILYNMQHDIVYDLVYIIVCFLSSSLEGKLRPTK